MPQTRPISRGKWRSSYLSFVSRGDLMKWAVVFCLFWASSAAAQGRDLDLVLAGGRVLDPETGLDAERDVGIASGSIAAVYEGSLSSRLKPGGTLIDARGLIVAPGFIDLHAHGQTNRANEFQAHDGVTTALELEGGYGGVGDWIASRKGRALLNFGASVSHGTLRVHAMPQYAEKVKALGSSAEAEVERELRDGLYAPLPEERTEALHQLFEKGLREGGLGIGMPHQYYPGADRREIFRVFEFAAEKDVPIYTHVRSIGVEAMQEVIADAAATGASLHIVHVNSMSLWDLPLVLEIIEGARKRGVDVTTEAYPYTAGSTSIESAIFDEGWQDRLRRHALRPGRSSSFRGNVLPHPRPVRARARDSRSHGGGREDDPPAREAPGERGAFDEEEGAAPGGSRRRHHRLRSRDDPRHRQLRG